VRWACPFHQGHNPTAFAVSKDRFYCWSCEASGDVIAWMIQRENLDFKTAVQQAAVMAGVDLGGPILPRLSRPDPRRPIRSARPLLHPPDLDWQRSSHFYVQKCQAYLWNEINQAALDYLRQRGLKDETIEQAQLGYDPGRQIITIPWYIKDELWRLGTKSLAEGGKAPLFAGFKQGLYNADRLTPEQPVLLLEGEFDALIVQQEVGDLVVAVATGGVTLGRQIKWVGRLIQMPQVLVAFDDDPAGDKAAGWWLKVLPHNAQRCRPLGAKDPNDMLIKAGLNLRQWLGEVPEAKPETKPEVGSLWQRLMGREKR